MLSTVFLFLHRAFVFFGTKKYNEFDMLYMEMFTLFFIIIFNSTCAPSIDLLWCIGHRSAVYVEKRAKEKKIDIYIDMIMQPKWFQDYPPLFLIGWGYASDWKGDA